DRRVDQRQVAERLREVAELLGGWADLLRVQAQAIGVGEHFLEDQARYRHAAGAGQRVDVPERADGEGPLVAAQAVRRGAGVVAVDQSVRYELPVYGPQRRLPHRVRRADEPDQRHQEDGGIEQIAVLELDVRRLPGVPALL